MVRQGGLVTEGKYHKWVQRNFVDGGYVHYLDWI